MTCLENWEGWGYFLLNGSVGWFIGCYTKRMEQREVAGIETDGCDEDLDRCLLDADIFSGVLCGLHFHDPSAFVSFSDCAFLFSVLISSFLYTYI